MACLQGETLGFTRRHIDCCFPELKKLAREAAPQWMTNQINDEPWKNSSIKDFNCYINCKSIWDPLEEFKHLNFFSRNRSSR